jgi:hypothetical protein
LVVLRDQRELASFDATRLIDLPERQLDALVSRDSESGLAASHGADFTDTNIALGLREIPHTTDWARLFLAAGGRNQQRSQKQDGEEGFAVSHDLTVS